MSRIIEELESLLFDWEAGTLDETGVQRVRELLRAHDEARDYYVQQQMINAALKLDVDAGLDPLTTQETITGGGETSSPSAPSQYLTDARPAAVALKGTSHVLRVSYWGAAAAALLIVALTGRLLQLEFFADMPSAPTAATNTAEMNTAEPNLGKTNTAETIAAETSASPRDERREPTSEGVALVTRLVDVVWSADQRPHEVGDALSPGRLALQSGYAQIEFFCGATVVVEGPAELDLRSPLLAHVRSGRLRAQVPPAARGFSLEVDDMKVVDLGTEFGLSVSAAGANVQVFDGEVELQPSDAEKRLVQAGEALVRAPDGTYSESQVTPDRFLDIAKLESRASDQREERYERWRRWSEDLRRDPRLIAYYAFDSTGDWLRRLSSSVEPKNEELDGAIVGAHQVPGRWAAKSGLEFKHPGDRVRVQVPGEFASLTFACWVKIDSLDRWYNSLFLTDHYNQGEPHWQILDTGQLFFSVRHKADDVTGPAAKKRTHHVVLSPPFWQPSMSGRWMHLATTYDADAGRTTHYLNGHVLHEESLDQELIVKTTRIGAATIGNWSIPTEPDAEFAIRNLNGSIDEFAIFAAPLTADEVREMYEHGKP